MNGGQCSFGDLLRIERHLGFKILPSAAQQRAFGMGMRERRQCAIDNLRKLIVDSGQQNNSKMM